jgi:hypothetical protein
MREQTRETRRIIVSLSIFDRHPSPACILAARMQNYISECRSDWQQNSSVRRNNAQIFPFRRFKRLPQTAASYDHGVGAKKKVVAA